MAGSKLLSVAEAAEKLGKTPRYISQLITAGRIKAEMVGSCYVIRAEDCKLPAAIKPGRKKK